MAMDGAVVNGERLSAFDLDGLREVFRKSVREHDVTAADWAEHAKLFLKRTTNRQTGKDVIGQAA
ncbi:hypothetical protein [Mesorhizobium sp. WSM3224]|uniref:hypothetical protein n=1 Tax=Mesorhizobium sp. WSM3224 TaxID=1040986 RepID=UPI0012EC0FE8|nr:hypothetical protein [Mesorhizobium sp. WSM3224]